MSSLKIDTGGGNVLDCIQVVEDVVMKHGDEIDAMCWQHLRDEFKELQAELDATIEQRDALDLEVQRLNKRLSPDRERVARAIAGAMLRQGHVMHGEAYWDIADAAINAMGEP